jgi:hypothetical protein
MDKQELGSFIIIVVPLLAVVIIGFLVNWKVMAIGAGIFLFFMLCVAIGASLSNGDITSND